MDPEDYFMAVAALTAKRSKDPNIQVGACIVNENDVIVGVGHNMMPQDCDEFPWGRNVNDVTGSKYAYVCHAGVVAVLNSKSACLNKCTMYTTLFPSAETAKLVAQVLIKKVVYLSDIFAESDDNIAAKEIFSKTRVDHKKFEPKNTEKIEIDFDFILNNSMQP